MITSYVIYALIFSVAFIYLAWRFRRSLKSPDWEARVPGFRPRVGFSILDGMQSVSLLLENESGDRIWVEEIEVCLADLQANNQAGEASCREALPIRQIVESRDTLPISLAGVLYKAAGEPQREYSCALSSVLRFRVNESWFERSLEDYRVSMVGLTAAGLRRERKRTPSAPEEPLRAPQESIAAVAAKLK
jgi:hypothetical protein